MIIIKRFIALSFVIFIFTAVLPGYAGAMVVNLGVDIGCRGDLNIYDFYRDNLGPSHGGWSGYTLRGKIVNPPRSYTVTLDTASVFGAYEGHINWAVLYVDGYNVDDCDKTEVLVQGVSVGEMWNIKAGESIVPIETGGMELGLDYNVDDSHYLLHNYPGINLNDLMNDSTFEITFLNHNRRLRRKYDIHGLNIQAGVDVVPEPSSLFLLLFGSASLPLFRRRK
jgi:hypothetical protein